MSYKGLYQGDILGGEKMQIFGVVITSPTSRHPDRPTSLSPDRA